IPYADYIPPNQTIKSVKTKTKGATVTMTPTGGIHPTGALAIGGSYSTAQTTEKQNDRITPKWIVEYENGDWGEFEGGLYHWQKNVSYTPSDNQQQEMEVKFSVGINVKESQTMLWVRDKSLKSQGYGIHRYDENSRSKSYIPDVTTPKELFVQDNKTLELIGNSLTSCLGTDEINAEYGVPLSLSIGVAPTDKLSWFKKMANKLIGKSSALRTQIQANPLSAPSLIDFKARGWDATMERWRMPSYPLWGETLQQARENLQIRGQDMEVDNIANPTVQGEQPNMEGQQGERMEDQEPMIEDMADIDALDI
ncbi:hypothetical protein B0H13DRAFT_1936686, partial [Mycena leptocephala]